MTLLADQILFNAMCVRARVCAFVSACLSVRAQGRMGALGATR